MKRLFIYYSLSGNGDVVSLYLKDKGVDVRKVMIKDEFPNHYILRIIVGGFLAGIHAKSKLVDFDNNIDKYDEIIIGSPIWNGRLSSPINSVLDEIHVGNKRLKFILYSGSGKAHRADKDILARYPDAEIIHIKEPKKNGIYIDID